MYKARKVSALVRRIDSELPGVGIYSPTDVNQKNVPNYTMRKKITELDKHKKGASSPGPAAYHKRSVSPRNSIS